MVDRTSALESAAPLLTSVHPPERDSQNDQPPTGGHQPQPLPLLDPDPRYFDRSATNAAINPYSLSVAFRHSGWLHNRGLVAASLSRTHQSPARRANFCNCGSNAYVLQSVENPNVYRIAGSSCHDRFCLPCAQERSQAIALNVLDLTADRTIRFLTLTLKASHDPLAAQLDKLYACFQALRRRKLWNDKVKGGVAFLEVTWSDTNQSWHPHFHILIEGSYLPHEQLKKLWYQITTDSFVVDIRPVRDRRTAARYVTKYASKPFNNTFLNRPNQLDEAILAFKGRKLLLTFGTWRGITLIDTPSEGSWQHVAPLETVIIDAARGDPRSRAILATLTDIDLNSLYQRAPPPTPPEQNPQPEIAQLTFFAIWQRDGTYVYPGKHTQNTG